MKHLLESRLAVLSVVMLVSSCAGPGEQRAEQNEGRIDFDVLDVNKIIEHSISESLLLRASGGPEGWDIQVLREPAGKAGFNLLYPSREWHGPYPCQVYAWSFAEKYFPNDRKVRVRGFPCEVRIRLLGCNTSGVGPDTRFTAGKVEVSWCSVHKTEGDV